MRVLLFIWCLAQVPFVALLIVHLLEELIVWCRGRLARIQER